jgi:hypothetical protein
MVEGFPLRSYAVLVDYKGRSFREGKVAISRELAAIFDRLGTTAETWRVRLARLSQGRLFGRVLAATCEHLQEVANQLGVRRLVNLGRCPALRRLLQPRRASAQIRQRTDPFRQEVACTVERIARNVGSRVECRWDLSEMRGGIR